MSLSSDLIKQFVDVTNDSKKDNKNNSNYYGIAVVNDSGTYVKMDGSEYLTPVIKSMDIKNGDRVEVSIENHSAKITSNITSPASGRGATDLYNTSIDESGEEIASGILKEAKEYVDSLLSKGIKTEHIESSTGYIKELTSDNITADKIKVSTGYVDELIAGDITAENINASYAKIKELETNKLDADSANIKFLNADLANLTEATIEKFYSSSGLIKDITVKDGTITGKLVGVTINGDLIEGNTLKADKLVVLGEDGLYYKLNVNALGEATASSDEKYQKGLDGSAIIAKSITATKINVSDLVAFDATIGGFNITEGSIYSGVKSAVNNTTRGIYLDKNGQFSIGDSDNFITFYKSTDGTYKLKISAEEMMFGSSGMKIEDAFEELKDEVSTLLRIESSRGTVFKNDNISTVLSAVIYRGSKRITDIDTLKSVIGPNAYLQWKWQRLNEDSYGIISSDDYRLSNGGFTFTLSPDDVDTKVTFMCELINE